MYGTWFAISGLVAAKKTYSNCLAIRKATDFFSKFNAMTVVGERVTSTAQTR